MLPFVTFELRRTFRNVRFLLFLVAMPVVLYLIWGREDGTAQGLPVPALLLATLGVYAASGGALIGGGSGVAEDRAAGWLRQLRVTPLRDTDWLVGRLVNGVLVIVPGVAAVGLAAVLYGHVHLAAGRWAELAALLLLGSIPFGFLGLLVGLTFHGKTAQVALVATFFTCAFLGGVMTGGQKLGPVADGIGAVTPSYHLVRSAEGIVGGHGPGVVHVAALAVIAAVAGAAAVFQWRRQEGNG
jgi:ABC-2 type transport system permease protein